MRLAIASRAIPAGIFFCRSASYGSDACADCRSVLRELYPRVYFFEIGVLFDRRRVQAVAASCVKYTRGYIFLEIEDKLQLKLASQPLGGIYLGSFAKATQGDCQA